jgi:hypothetical protein
MGHELTEVQRPASFRQGECLYLAPRDLDRPLQNQQHACMPLRTAEFIFQSSIDEKKMGRSHCRITLLIEVLVEKASAFMTLPVDAPVLQPRYILFKLTLFQRLSQGLCRHSVLPSPLPTSSEVSWKQPYFEKQECPA